MKNVKLIAVLTVLIIIAGFHTHAQRGPGEGMEFADGRKGYTCGPGKGMMKNADRSSRLEALLDLTEEQSGEIEKIHLNNQKEILPAINKIDEKQAQLNSNISGNQDLKKIDQLIDEIGALRVTIQKQHVRMHFEIRELLTDEQQIKYDSFSGRAVSGRGNHSGGYGWNRRHLK